MTAPSKLLAAAGLEHLATVSWGTPVPASRPGIYIVSLSRDPDEDKGSVDAKVSAVRTGHWLAACPWLTLKDSRPTPQQLAAHLARWWLPTAVVYVGLTTQPLRARVQQYYGTPLGAVKPHAGGNWLQTLDPAVLGSCWVHVAELPVGPVGEVKPRVELAEEAALVTFLRDVAEFVPEGHPESDLPLPFANLQVIRRGRKTLRMHGIKWRTVPD